MLVLRSCVMVPIHCARGRNFEGGGQVRKQREHLGPGEGKLRLADREEAMAERVNLFPIHFGDGAFGADG